MVPGLKSSIEELKRVQSGDPPLRTPEEFRHHAEKLATVEEKCCEAMVGFVKLAEHLVTTFQNAQNVARYMPEEGADPHPAWSAESFISSIVRSAWAPAYVPDPERVKSGRFGRAPDVSNHANAAGMAAVLQGGLPERHKHEQLYCVPQEAGLPGRSQRAYLTRLIDACANGRAFVLPGSISFCKTVLQNSDETTH